VGALVLQGRLEQLGQSQCLPRGRSGDLCQAGGGISDLRRCRPGGSGGRRNQLRKALEVLPLAAARPLYPGGR
jgi:hypothetical protein